MVRLSLTCTAQGKRAPASAPSSEIDISDGVRVPSPDGSHVLVGKRFNILLVDQRTGERRPVMAISQNTDQVGWSPDGTHFFVDDREASNVEKAYIYDAATLAQLNVRGQIATDVAQLHPRYARYLLGSDHIYYHAERWLDVTHVEVSPTGHFDGFCLKSDQQGCCNKIYPTHSFLLRYSVQSNGETRLLSASAGPPGSRAWKQYFGEQGVGLEDRGAVTYRLGQPREFSKRNE